MTFIYKHEWENDFQWKARQIFTQTHEDKYEDVKLASLSNAWSNWRFHGCTYCKGVQDLLGQLDSELPDELHAAMRELPAHKGMKEVNFKKASEKTENDNSDKKKPIIKGLTIYFPKDPAEELSPIAILHESAQKSRKNIEFQDLGLKQQSSGDIKHVTAVAIEGKLIATGTALNKKESKRDCASKALDILRETQAVIFKTSQAGHKELKSVEKGELVKSAYHSAKKLDESNVGNQLLRKMGWTGSGGIGRSGIAEPIFVESSDGRKGFGHDTGSPSIKRDTVEDILVRFIRENKDNEIKFSNELSKDERALVHKLCQKFGLKHRSFGKGEERYLVVSKH